MAHRHGDGHRDWHAGGRRVLVTRLPGPITDRDSVARVWRHGTDSEYPAVGHDRHGASCPAQLKLNVPVAA